MRALDPSHIGGYSLTSDDPDWRANREQEYRDAMQALALSGQVTILMNVCVYNDRPKFMKPTTNKEQANLAIESLMGLSKGLDILVHLWGRTPSKN